MGTLWVSAVKFHSTHLKNFSTSPDGGTPIAAADSVAAVGNASGRG